MSQHAKSPRAEPVTLSEASDAKLDVVTVPDNPRTLEEYRQHLQYYKDRGITYRPEEHGYNSDDDDNDNSDHDDHSTDEEHAPAPAQKGTKKTFAQVTLANESSSHMIISPRQQSGLVPMEVETAPIVVQPVSLASIKKTRKMPRHLKTKHRKINREHPEFELTYDMMLGIRTTVSLVEAKPYHPLSAQDLKFEIKLRFPGYGSSITPAHEARDFKFKDYMPEVFRHIRARFDIDPAEYLMCVCGNFEFLEFISNSKSGQFFFYSHDRRYMIKTVTQEESKFLRKILPAYYDHIMKNPNTLLTRFFGMHRVKPHKKREQHFLIMGSVFYTQRQIDLVYDLKGSTQGRQVTPEERQSSSCVFKDLDFLQDNQRIALGPPFKEELCAQLQRDVKFLQELDIMDYSLLVGVHDMRRHREREEDDEEDESVVRQGVGALAGATEQPQSITAQTPADHVADFVSSTGTDTGAGQPPTATPVVPSAAGANTDTPAPMDANVQSSDHTTAMPALYNAASVPADHDMESIRTAPVEAEGADVELSRVDSHSTATTSDDMNASLHAADGSSPHPRTDEDGQRRERKSLFVPSKYNKCATPQQHHVSFKPAPTTQELLRVSTVTAASTTAPVSTRALRPHVHAIPEESEARAAAHSFSDIRDLSTVQPTTPQRVQSLHGLVLAPSLDEAAASKAVTAPVPEVAAAPVVEEPSLPQQPPQPKPGLDFLPAYSVFMQDDGGIRGRDENGEPNEFVYYMGIIDILTVYNWRKRGENFLKSFKYKKEEISAVHPKPYARRFVEFISAAVD